MKKYIPKPGVPNPTPAPGAKKGDGRVYAGGPGFADLNPRLKPKPSPKPKPNPKPKPKNSQVSDEEIMPKKFPKPKGNRLRMLEEINRMNGGQVTRNMIIKKKKPATGGR